MRHSYTLLLSTLGTCLTLAAQTAPSGPLPASMIPAQSQFSNPTGVSETYSSTGPIDPNGLFFQALGANGRSCATCHQPDQGWTISAAQTRNRFVLSNSLDPLFRTSDGANCDSADVSTLDARTRAFSLLITRGLIRIGMAVPAGAEFQVTAVSNPYGCGDKNTISVYRRPLPTTNLRFISAVLWDGRESNPPNTQKISFATNPADLLADLAQLTGDATMIHEAGQVALTQQQKQAIVNFEMGLSTAQIIDADARHLTANGAKGGPLGIAAQEFFVGINDPLGGNPLGYAFTSTIFNLFDSWLNAPAESAQASVARGQTVFNTKNINITGVAGINDTLNQPVVAGFCGTCHSATNVGNHSLPLPIGIGVADLTNPLGVKYLPVITLKNNATGATVQTTDLGRALITGKWADIGKFKGPVLRGLASRAPYFHNGSAQSLSDVVDFYDSRFQVGFTQQEKADLIAFLRSL